MSAADPLAVVLVVDDEPATRELLKMRLEAAGYRVLLAADGPAALDLVHLLPVDTVLLDVMMPGLDGREVARRLKAAPKTQRIPIIALTASTEPRLAREVLAAGAEEFLRKPIDHQQLLSRVANMVRLKRLSDELVRVNRKLQERARMSESELQAVLQSMPSFVARLDRDSRIEWLNRTVSGVRSEDVLGRRWLDLGRPENRPRREAAWREVVEGRRAASVEGRWAPPGQEERIYVARLAPLEREGELRGAVLVALDVTEGRRTEAALQEAQARLQQAEKLEALGALAGGVAHDFNNLLTAIGGFAELVGLSLEPDDPRGADLAEIVGVTRRGAQLTRQLLSVARRRPVAPRTVDVAEAVREAYRLLRQAVGDGIEVAVVLPETPAVVRMDPGALDQVLMNLCVNAGHAVAPSGTVTIRVACRDEVLAAGSPEPCVALSVHDTGPGIPAELQARIFEPFFSTKGDQGTGLGLATCEGIASQAGGALRVESQDGEGTTFTLVLPRVSDIWAADARSDGRPDARTARPSGFAALAGRRVLVVEDQAAVREVVERALAGAGGQVVAAASAEEAVEAVRTGGPPALVVTDVMLPGRNGLALLGELRASDPALPAVVISGYMRSPQPFAASGSRTVFLAKPFTGRDLLQALAELS